MDTLERKLEERWQSVKTHQKKSSTVYDYIATKNAKQACPHHRCPFPRYLQEKLNMDMINPVEGDVRAFKSRHRLKKHLLFKL